MKTNYALNIDGGNLADAQTRLGERMHVRVSKSRQRSDPYPEGCIGANLAKRNYVKYLIERYHRCREVDGRVGRNGRFHYSEIFTNVESKFKSTTYLIPEGRFAELVDFLYYRIDNTILGRVNGQSGIPNYKSFDEYVMQCVETTVNA